MAAVACLYYPLPYYMTPPSPLRSTAITSAPLPRTQAPAQTMPAPTREAKAEAAALMRAMARVWALRGDGPV